MSTPVDPSLRALDDRDCCEGLEISTPAVVENRPGLGAVAYRTGTWREFKETMLARLSGGEHPALARLKTREDDDFAIALLDAWAVVADVLTFYQERYANESYLRTARERRSLVELGRLIGYQPSPGVAAQAFLAFTVDDDAGSASVAEGTRVQSLPAAGELPQTFETVEAIEARAAWNVLRPRRSEPHPLTDDDGRPLERYLLAGADTGLRVGDGVLVGGDEGAEPRFRLVAEVAPDAGSGRTGVRLEKPPPLDFLILPVVMQIALPMVTAIPFSAVTMQLLAEINPKIGAAELHARAEIEGFEVGQVFANLSAAPTPPGGLMAFRRRASIFGHNAPQWKVLPAGARTDHESDWVDSMSLDEVPGATPFGVGDARIFLDSTYPEITRDSWIVLQDGGAWKNLQVRQVAEQSRAEFAISAKVTRLSVDSGDLGRFSVRGTTVHCQSELLPLARRPIDSEVADAVVELDSLVEGLAAGRSLIVCGELADNRGNRACERVVIAAVEHRLGADSFTRLRLERALSRSYVRDTVTIHGNVARASHGETVADEALGSGDGTLPFQRFALQRTPLTHVGSATASGSESTLEVRVDGVRWQQVEDLARLGPEDRKHALRTDDQGSSRVLFGDGRRGARLPTGLENVTASYRFGIGSAGNVAARSLTLMARRPAGVAAVTNPEDAGGGTDPEDADQLRANASLRVKTLDRIVSLTDYESFALAFAGIGKALATWTWNGEVRGVFVTIAGPGGAEIAQDAPVAVNLLAALRRAGDQLVPVRVGSYRRAFFRFGGGIKVHPDHRPEIVLGEIERQAREAFSFDRRKFGQPVTLGEVTTLAQRVPGVVAVHIEALYRSGQGAELHRALAAAVPRAGAELMVEAAELLLLDPRPLALGVSA